MADLVALAIVVGAVLVASVDWVRDRREPDPVEALKEKRVAGELSEREFERRLELLLDDETERIRAAVEPIPGVGETTSRYLAERFDSLDDLREADLEELRSVPDVGEQRAEAIKFRLQS